MPEPDPASADPRAYRTADADGKPLAAFVGDGSVWLMVGGELARLDPVSAMRLGGRLGGAAQRTIRVRSLGPKPDDRGPVDPRGMQVAYKVIADRLERRIRAGEFGGPGRLPTGRELSEWYGASRATIARARRELIARGVVVVSPGLGTFTA